MVDPWTPAEWNLTLPAGADFDDFVIWMQPDGVTPVDVTDFTVKQEFRRGYGDENPLLTITHADYITVGTSDGKLIYKIPAVKMSLLGDVRPVAVVTSLEVTSPAGKVYRLFDGNWTVTPEATK